MKIPFVDLKAQYKSIKSDIDKAIFKVIDETSFIKGKYVDEFEDKFAKIYGVRNVVSCANGTDALYISLKAMGIKKGDEVITTAHSWISTSETITQTGAKVVFVDINRDFFTIDTSKIEEKINENTKAIIPVHIYGQPANMEKIKQLAAKYNLKIIEDCAQAHFAKWKEDLVGTIGDAGTFSFFPGKNLGAYGDAGAIITNDDELALKMRMFANHGALKKHEHKIEGINSRMDGMQAAILTAKLKHIKNWTSARISIANKYLDLLSDAPNVVLPEKRFETKHVFHLFVIRINERELMQKHLEDNHISTSIHYPTPLPFLKAYDYLGYKEEDLPVVSGFKNKILSIPIFPELTSEQINFIADKILEI